MAGDVQRVTLTGLFPSRPTAGTPKAASSRQVYEEHQPRVYCLAFWMTGSEPAAEELMKNAFLRAFAASACPDSEAVDRALLKEVRELMSIGTLTLECPPATSVVNARANVKRCHLERAVMQVPATERMIFLMHDVEDYEHERIARTLGITPAESRQGLHQARLRLRELLVQMQD